MDALADPGVQPVPMVQHPMSPCSFYPKHDSATYYFPNPNPSKPGYGSYPTYPTAAEGDAWIKNQKALPQPFARQPLREEAVQDDRNESSRPYIPPTNSESNSHHIPAVIHHQMHQSQLQTPFASSLSPYSHGNISPLSRDGNQKKYSEDNKSSCDDLSTFYSSQKLRSLHGSTEPPEFPRLHDHRPLQNDTVSATYDYKKQNINGRFTNDNYRSLYYQHFHGTPQNIKNNDTASVISYHKSRTTPVIPHEKQQDDGKREDDTACDELKESPNVMTTKHYHRDFDRKQNFAITSDHILYRREMENTESSSKVKLTHYYNDRDSINNQHIFEEKDFSSALKSKQIDTVQDSIQKNVTSSEGNQKQHISHQYYPVAASPHYFNQSHVALDALQSPTSQSVQSESLHGSTLFSSTPVKCEPPSSMADHRFSREDPSTLRWVSSSSPTTPHMEQTQKQSFNKDYEQKNHNSKDSINVTEHKEPSKSDGQLSEQKILTRIMTPSQPVQTSEDRKSPNETSNRLSPSRRYSNDGFAKLNSSDSCEDGSLDAKREPFSDDGEDDSACEESTPHSPGFSPFHDTSVAYPHHFTHPFFPSQGHGPIPGLKFPFGSLQGHHDSTTGYPFRHMPGMPQDLTLVGHMHSARPPFITSVGPGIDPARQMAGEKDIYFCHLCSYSGKSKPEFDSHMNTHFEFNCPHCDYTSRTEGRLKRHVKDFHSDDSCRRSMPGRPKIYKCKQCQFLATDKDAFWAHSRTHIKEDKLLQCPQCPFVTEYKHHLEYHLRNHFGSKPFKCPKCNYSCVNKSMLNSHMKSHTNVYQYRCSDCTYATKYCHSLKLHLKKYNHKPATVLNQDGSLPQGLDVEASGLSIVSKRGPPRGPRGTRKDKPEPYLNHLFEMPQMPLGVAGMNPILTGILPFWPMLPQVGLPGHTSPQSGMLPGIRNIVQQMGIREDHAGRIDSSKIDFINDMNEKDNENSKKHIADKAKICRLCGFVAETREALGLHFMQLHKEEAKEVAKSYGLSETFVTESFKKIIPEAKLKQQQQQEEFQQSDSDEDEGETHHGKLDTDFQQKENRQKMQLTSGQKEESSKMPPVSWSPVSSSENYDGRSRPSDMYYSLKGVSNSQNEDDNAYSNIEVDVLQQMTLKFGMGALTDNKSLFANDEDRMQEKELLKEVRKSTSDFVPRVSQTPLDLTKPKSVSPPILSDSPRLLDDNDHVDEEERMSNSDFEVLSNQGDLRSNLVQPEKLLKRLLRENDSVCMTSPSAAEMLIAPRKRSRKGKAYKLDTLCLKLQRRQSSTSHDENDECDIDMEGSFHEVKPHETNEEEAKKNTGEDYSCPNSEDELWKNRSLNSPHNSMKNGQHGFEDVEMTEVTACKSENEIIGAEDVSIDERLCESSNFEAEKSQQNKNMHEESDLLSENKAILQEETDLEFQKLHTSLHVFKQSPSSDVLEPTKSEISVDNIVENTFNKGYKNDETLCEDQSSLDNKNNGTATSSSQSAQKPLEVGKVDQVEMINTVIENRKKPVPPAVRRGTELAWKLLNDPVHPVTTLPLPVETLPSPRPSKTPSLPHSTGALLPEIVNSPAATRKDSKPHPLPPQYSQPLHLNVPQPHHSNALQPHGTQAYHKHPSLHPHAPQIHHPHVQTSLMSMKPLVSIPLPSTPMAYIPPTNRMMSEPNMVSNSSRMKHIQKDLYECTYCDLSFRDCVMYTVHMGYHSNQNPFQCNSCGVVSRDKVEFFLHIARSPHV